MSRGNDAANARKHNVGIFQNFKAKLVERNLNNDPDKWVRVTHTFLEFVRDARIYYDEARPDIVDCVEVATHAVESRVPTELRHLRPITRSHLQEPYRVAFDELKRLLVVVGSYQPEMLQPPKGGDSRQDLLSRITACVAAFGIDPESLINKASLEATMQIVSLDDKSRQIIFNSIAKRRPDALSVLSSARSTPSIATPVLSLPSPHTSASPQVVAPATPTAYSGPTPIPMHVAAPYLPQQAQTSPVLAQAMPSPTTPSSLASPVRANADAPKPKKQPKWMARDLELFRKEKMANAGGATASPVTQQFVPTAISHPSPMAPVPPPAPLLNPLSSISHGQTVSPTAVGPSGGTQAVVSHAMEIDAKLSSAASVDEAMDLDTPPLDDPAPLDDDKPLPFTLPTGPYRNDIPPTWSDLFEEAIRASHEHKLSISDMLRYVASVYPMLKGAKHAASAMFNSKMAKQTGRATVSTGVTGDLRIAKRSKADKGPRFIRTSDVYPVTWTVEDLTPDVTRPPSPADSTGQPSDQTEANLTAEPTIAVAEPETSAAAVKAPAPEIIALEGSAAVADDAPSESAQDVLVPEATPSLPYTLRPGPYSSEQPSKHLAVLVQEAILAGQPEKALSQPDILSYIRTTYPFYISSPTLEDEVSTLLLQHFAPKDDGRWSLWIRDGSDEERPVPFMLPLGPRSSAKPERPLVDLMREAILASNEGCLTQRDVAAYVLTVAPYYNGADEALPFGQLLREHFVRRGSDAEGKTLWGVKDGGEPTEAEKPAVEGNEAMLVEDAELVQKRITPIVAQDESRASSRRPPKYKGPHKSAAVVESDEEQKSDMEMLDLPTPSTASASAAIPSPIIEVPLPPAVTSAPARPAASSSPRSRPYVLPPGPSASHKPPKTNEELIVEALLASPTRELKKKDIARYIQTVYPWFQRDERAIQSCSKMVENMLARLKVTRVTSQGKGWYKLNESVNGSKVPEEIEDEDMNDVTPPSQPKTTPFEPSTSSAVLKIRIPARNVSGDSSSSTSHKRSAPSASPARSESPAVPKRVRLIVRDQSGATSAPTAELDGGVGLKTKAPLSAPSVGDMSKPKTNGVQAMESAAAEADAATPQAEEQAADVEMQHDAEPNKAPDLPPLPPVSFGKDACLVDAAFGRPLAASFTLHVHPEPEQWKMLERWRNAARNDDDVSEALCYSLVCYRSEDVHSLKEHLTAEAWGEAVARTEIPVSLHNQALHSLCLTGNGRTVPFPLTWMTATASPLFLDITSYLVPGDNLLTLVHTTDLSVFAFAIVAHRPNAHQLRWLDARRQPWRHLQAQISNAIQVPQLDYGALLIASKDVSKVDLKRGVPQALLTLS